MKNKKCPLNLIFIGFLLVAYRLDNILSLFSKKKSDQDSDQDPDEESKHLGGMPLRA